MALSLDAKAGNKTAAAHALIALSLAFGVYFVLGMAGILLMREVGNIVLFWPANAAVVCLALWSPRFPWRAVPLGAVAANAVIQFAFGDPWFLCFGFPIANGIEVALFIAAFRHFRLFRGQLVDLRDAIAAVSILALVPIPGAVIGAFFLGLAFEAPFASAAIHWWAGDTVSAFIVLLPFLSAAKAHVRSRWWRSFSVAKMLEVPAIAAATIAQLQVLLNLDLPVYLALTGPALWIALRLGVFWSALSGSVFALGMSLLTLTGWWPIIDPVSSLGDNVMQLQIILMLIGLPPFFVSASIAAREKAEERLSLSEKTALEKSEELEATLASMNQGLSMFDAAGRLVLWNLRYAELFGMGPEALKVGTHLVDILRARQQEGSFDGDPETLVARQVERLRLGHTVRTSYRLGDGRSIDTVASPMHGGGWVSTHEDVTDRENSARKIAYAAHHDVLTGLANRVEIRNRIKEMAANCQSGNSFCVFVLDLDRFKAINDTFGHAAGDKVLVGVAARICSIVRQDDVVARLGGDEFAVLSQTVGDPREDASAIAARLLDAIGAPYDVDGRALHIGVSIGIAFGPDHGTDADTLFRNADSALYKVKDGGKNAFRFFDSQLEAEARERRELESDLRDAIAGGQLLLHYQPITSLANGHRVGAEALIRWNHPKRGLLMPEAFIPIAEETGLIVPIGEWIIQQACRDAAMWPIDMAVAVNISVAQLGRSDLFGMVTHALLRSGLTPRRLELEVTEAVFLRNDETILSDLHQLQQLGVSLSLDDFGTGFSSLGYLRRLPFDKIKIDRSFISDIADNVQSAAVVCAVANLARSLGIDTVAEGLEDHAQVQLVKAAGCSHAQGYYFDRPVPQIELTFDGPVAGQSMLPVAS